MKKIYLLLLMLILCLTAYAHPPTEMATTYDSNTETITSVITHPVDDPESHFIAKVKILLNGEEIIVDEFSRQDNKNNQTVSYVINAEVRSGDKIVVEAYCNKTGMVQQEITLE